ncbi:hypothetical protein [Clostridium paridis]|uniref:Uncharacterized protein n=1 Tax=Clostridium paridis TaxID=2803863 RepID=A0A937FHH1_9CLOT|nr:hypothetical protein [Clostridium paridis]MBL4932103.1 hypothetical protein [Clostridium paridis]
MNIKSYFFNVNTFTEKLIEENLSEFVEYSLEILPEFNGVYFIYKKDTEDLMFIGSTSGSGNLKNKLLESIMPEYVSETFKNKVMEDVFKTTSWVENEIGEENKNIEYIGKVIEYIKSNYKLKFLLLPNEVEENEVLLVEKACISLKKPIYNVP